MADTESSADLLAFLADWDARVRRGEVSTINEMEAIVLSVYDQWLQQRRRERPASTKRCGRCGAVDEDVAIALDADPASYRLYLCSVCYRGWVHDPAAPEPQREG